MSVPHAHAHHQLVIASRRHAVGVAAPALGSAAHVASAGAGETCTHHRQGFGEGGRVVALTCGVVTHAMELVDASEVTLVFEADRGHGIVHPSYFWNLLLFEV